MSSRRTDALAPGLSGLALVCLIATAGCAGAVGQQDIPALFERVNAVYLHHPAAGGQTQIFVNVTPVWTRTLWLERTRGLSVELSNLTGRKAESYYDYPWAYIMPSRFVVSMCLEPLWEASADKRGDARSAFELSTFLTAAGARHVRESVEVLHASDAFSITVQRSGEAFQVQREKWSVDLKRWETDERWKVKYSGDSPLPTMGDFQDGGSSQAGRFELQDVRSSGERVAYCKSPEGGAPEKVRVTPWGPESDPDVEGSLSAAVGAARNDATLLDFQDFLARHADHFVQRWEFLPTERILPQLGRAPRWLFVVASHSTSEAVEVACLAPASPASTSAEWKCSASKITLVKAPPNAHPVTIAVKGLADRAVQLFAEGPVCSYRVELWGENSTAEVRTCGDHGLQVHLATGRALSITGKGVRGLLAEAIA